jgi:hypothetical protein
MRASSWIFLSTVFTHTVVGCGEVVEVNQCVSHICNSNRNSVWQSHAYFHLDHADTRQCPLPHNPDDLVETSAVVYDAKTEPGGSVHAATMALSVYDSYHTGSWYGIGSLGEPAIEYFAWGPNRNGVGPYEWQAAATVQYTASGSPDWLEVEVGFYSTWELAKAWVELEHSCGDEGGGSC